MRYLHEMFTYALERRLALAGCASVSSMPAAPFPPVPDAVNLRHPNNDCLGTLG